MVQPQMWAQFQPFWPCSPESAAINIRPLEQLDTALRFDANMQTSLTVECEMTELGKGSAMAQLKARQHADEYRVAGELIHCIGVQFGRSKRSAPAIDVKRV